MFSDFPQSFNDMCSYKNSQLGIYSQHSVFSLSICTKSKNPLKR